MTLRKFRHRRQRSYFKGKQQEHRSENGNTEYEPHNVRNQDHGKHCQDLYVDSDRNVGWYSQLLGRQQKGGRGFNLTSKGEQANRTALERTYSNRSLHNMLKTRRNPRIVNQAVQIRSSSHRGSRMAPTNTTLNSRKLSARSYMCYVDQTSDREIKCNRGKLVRVEANRPRHPVDLFVTRRPICIGCCAI